MGTVWNSWQTQWSGTSTSRRQISSTNVIGRTKFNNLEIQLH